MIGTQEIQVQANTGSMNVELEANTEQMSTVISANVGQKDQLISQFLMGNEGIFDNTFGIEFN